MKIPNPFATPTPLEVATKQLHVAQLQLLEALGAREAANGHVSVLEARVERLQQTVQTYSGTPRSTNPL